MPNQARYQLRVFSPTTGALVTTITKWDFLNYEKRVNDYHLLTIALEADDPNVAHFLLDAMIEVWRRNDGGSWYKELVVLHRTPQYNLYENGRETFTSYCRGLNDLLHRRHVVYFANTAYTLKSAPADDVMKAFVRENATSAANIAARRSFGVFFAQMQGLTVTADTSQAPVWAGARAWQNLHDILVDVSLPSGTDFEVVRVGDSGLAFEFNTYYPQRGVDRSSTLTFAPHLGNMKSVVMTKSRTEEANIVYVLGQGEDAARQVVPRVSAEVFAANTGSLWNWIETTRDARSQPGLAELQSFGDEQLKELAAQDQFEFEILQTDTRQYGRDYDVGDIIRAEYRNVNATKKIVAVKVSMQEGKEIIVPEFADIPTE